MISDIKCVENKDRDDLVSILIPCYNHEKYIVDCLDSLISQTYKRIELIVCDDASADRSFDVLCTYRERLEARFERVVLLKNESNSGITVTANKMIKEARGSIYKLIASDDMLFPEYTEQMVLAFKKNEDVDVVVSNGYRVGDSAYYTDYLLKGYAQNNDDQSALLVYQNPPEFDNDLFAKLYQGNFIFAPGMSIRSRAYELYGLYDESIMIEDWEYSLRLSKENRRFYFLDQPLVLYRISENSATSMKKNSDLERRRIYIYDAELKIIKKYGEYVDNNVYAKRLFEYLLKTEESARRQGHYNLLKLVEEEEKRSNKLGLEYGRGKYARKKAYIYLKSKANMMLDKLVR